MRMRDQNVFQTAESQAAAEQLALRALAAIHHEAIFVVCDDGGGKAAFGQWRRGSSAEEGDFKHAGNAESRAASSARLQFRILNSKF